MTAPRWPKWQPISSAPKDGRDVLLCREGERGVEIGYWAKSGGHWQLRNAFRGLWPPTHFAPLPDAVRAPATGELP